MRDTVQFQCIPVMAFSAKYCWY